MSANFQVVALPERLFESYQDMTPDQLLQHHAAWVSVDSSPGYPCRVTLEDAAVGEDVLALSFAHHQVSSPYRSAGPIFVRKGAKQAVLEVNDVPLMLRHRSLSIRGYNADALMIVAEVAQGSELEDTIARCFENPAVEYLHIHNAMPGCFNCAVVRA
jgi:hypothetical protein